VIERVNVQSGSPRLPTRCPQGGAVAEQVETVCLEAVEGHVGRIWGKKYERLRRSATGFFDWKNTVAGLTEMVGYKSKTSVFRLLKEQCNEQTMASFVDSLTPHLDEAWAERFRKTLRVEKYGLQKYRMFVSMIHAAILSKALARMLSHLSMPHLIIGKPDFPTSISWIDVNH